MIPASWDTSKQKRVLLRGHNPSLLSGLFLWPDDLDSGWPQCPWSLWEERKSEAKALEGAWFCILRRKSWNWNPISSPHLLPRIKEPYSTGGQGTWLAQGESSPVAFPLRASSPSAPPCDMVASCGRHSPHVRERLAFHRLGGQGKLVKQLVWISDGFNCLFPDSALSSFL